MSNQDKLRAWLDDQRENHGLIGMDFFPGTNPDMSLEDACGDVLKILTGAYDVSPPRWSGDAWEVHILLHEEEPAK